MIEFRSISKTFGERKVLDDVSGIFEKGKLNLIIGGSGTGKSVLIKCIVGLIKPDTGYALFDGRNFTEGNETEKREIRKEIGMLFQGSALFDSKTVEENVRFPLDMLTNMSMSEKTDRVYFCLKRVGLEHASQRMPSEISGGMKKRVGIARAIVLNSQYLFCDEPNSGLDPLTAIRIDELIQEITYEYQTTTVVVTHDMNSVMGIGDYIMFLYQGKKVWEGNKNNILDTREPALQEFLFCSQLIREMRK